MKTRRRIALSAICTCLLVSISLLPASSRGQSLASLQWGATVGDLQMSISTTNSRKADVPELQLIFRNVGEKDITLNLGTMLANGKVQLPDRISVHLTDVTGKTRELHFVDGRYAAVMGRRDDYIVPLRSGSIYGLKIGLDKFYSSDTNEFGSKLPSGKYQITAQFEGEGAKALNIDTQGIGLMSFWKGKLQSNTIMVEK